MTYVGNVDLLRVVTRTGSGAWGGASLPYGISGEGRTFHTPAVAYGNDRVYVAWIDEEDKGSLATQTNQGMPQVRYAIRPFSGGTWTKGIAQIAAGVRIQAGAPNIAAGFNPDTNEFLLAVPVSGSGARLAIYRVSATNGQVLDNGVETSTSTLIAFNKPICVTGSGCVFPFIDSPDRSSPVIKFQRGTASPSWADTTAVSGEYIGYNFVDHSYSSQNGTFAEGWQSLSGNTALHGRASMSSGIGAAETNIAGSMATGLGSNQYASPALVWHHAYPVLRN